jgi:hypothetical protein
VGFSLFIHGDSPATTFGSGASAVGAGPALWKQARHQPVEVHFGPYQFQVPDALSFIWQFREIFVDEFYRFYTTRPTPVIFDCGTNIGTSVVYFRQTYPTARIVAFEADETIGKTLEENLRKNQISGVEGCQKSRLDGR